MDTHHTDRNGGRHTTHMPFTLSDTYDEETDGPAVDLDALMSGALDSEEDDR